MSIVNKIISRNWISPVITVAFLVVSISGVLLTLNIHIGNIKGLHQWLGYVFVVAGLVHLYLNLRAFVAYFRRRIATLATIVSILVSLTVLCTTVREPELSHVAHYFDANKDGVLDGHEIENATILLSTFSADNNSK